MELRQEQSVLIIGAGLGGSALLDIFSKEDGIKVIGVVDTNQDAAGIQLARELGIPVFAEVAAAMEGAGNCIIFNMTHDQALSDVAARYVGTGKVIGGDEAKFFWHIILRLQKLKSALWENQSRLQAVLHNVQEGIISIDPQGIIEDANPAVAEIFGYTQEELVNQPIKPLIPELKKDLHDAHAKPKRGLGRYRELGGFHKKGKHIPLEINIAKMELGAATHFVCLVRDITERKKAEEKLTQLALYDQLTGLPNRTMFHEKLTSALLQARRAKSEMALLFIDLDGFKTVNDTLGHGVGDQLLREVGKRLRISIRESDTAARMGGDEFMVILNNLHDRSQALLIAEKIINAINQPMQLDGNKCNVGASIGIAIYPEQAENASDLVRAADSAMYYAKASGKNAYRLSNQHLLTQQLDGGMPASSAPPL